MIETLRPTAAMLDPKGMALAHAATKARIKGANSGPKENVIDPPSLDYGNQDDGKK